MATEILKKGGYAFPSEVMADDLRSGMTLRDWFAGQALIAISFDPDFDAATRQKDASAIAYEVADAMLKARED